MVFAQLVTVADKFYAQFADGRVRISQKITFGCKSGVMDMRGGFGQYLAVQRVVE